MGVTHSLRSLDHRFFTSRVPNQKIAGAQNLKTARRAAHTAFYLIAWEFRILKQLRWVHVTPLVPSLPSSHRRSAREEQHDPPLQSIAASSAASHGGRPPRGLELRGENAAATIGHCAKWPRETGRERPRSARARAHCCRRALFPLGRTSLVKFNCGDGPAGRRCPAPHPLSPAHHPSNPPPCTPSPTHTSIHTQEDDVLLRMAAKLGTKSWVKIASFVPGRSAKSCRLRCAAGRPAIALALPPRRSTPPASGRRPPACRRPFSCKLCKPPAVCTSKEAPKHPRHPPPHPPPPLPPPPSAARQVVQPALPGRAQGALHGI